nr:hypothetical protein [Rhizobium wenxiniae]
MKHLAELPASRFASRRTDAGTPIRPLGSDRALWSEPSHSFKVEDTSLDHLIDRHIPAHLKKLDAVRAWDQRRATGQPVSVAYANLLSDVVEEEEASRLAVLRYRPQSDREAKLKLTYLAAYLIATRGTLATHEPLLIPPVERDKPKMPIC